MLVLNTACIAGLVCSADDEADRQALVRQQNKVAALEAQLAALKVCGLCMCSCAVSGCRGVGMAGYLHHGCTTDPVGSSATSTISLCSHAT